MPPPETADELRAEVRFLRSVIDEMVSDYDVPWSKIKEIARRYRAHTSRTSWLLTYLFALDAAERSHVKPFGVLSELPVGEP